MVYEFVWVLYVVFASVLTVVETDLAQNVIYRKKLKDMFIICKHIGLELIKL